jgi:DNA polymerase-3 subunit epsilon
MQLHLTRPIIFFDLETTGVDVSRDHIVELCYIKRHPNGNEESKTLRIRPADSLGGTLPIPESSTAIHGITDADVAACPTFRELSDELLQTFQGCDLAGFNSNKFDIPLLVEEFLRCGKNLELQGCHFVDVQNIFHKMEQRTLKAAYRFYCHKELENAHSADADTLATYEVLMAQLDRYQDAEYTAPDGKVSKPVVNDVEQLSRFSRANQWADLAGHIAFDGKGREVFNFGKHKGKTLEQVFEHEPAYYDWMMKADFPLSTKALLTEVWTRMRNKKLNDLKLHFGQ